MGSGSCEWLTSLASKRTPNRYVTYAVKIRAQPCKLNQTPLSFDFKFTLSHGTWAFIIKYTTHSSAYHPPAAARKGPGQAPRQPSLTKTKHEDMLKGLNPLHGIARVSVRGSEIAAFKQHAMRVWTARKVSSVKPSRYASPRSQPTTVRNSLRKPEIKTRSQTPFSTHYYSFVQQAVLPLDAPHLVASPHSARIAPSPLSLCLA